MIPTCANETCNELACFTIRSERGGILYLCPDHYWNAISPIDDTQPVDVGGDADVAVQS